MADVKWIKLATGIFDNRKIRQIEKMPDGDSLIVIWIKLLCLAGTTNDNGLVYLTRDVPYTDEMLAAQFDRPISTIRLALNTFERFGMVEIVNDFLLLASWEKYQNTDGLDKIREQTRDRVSRFREAQKQLASNVTCNVTVTHGNATELDKDKDIDKELEEDTGNCARPSFSYESVKSLYNSICVSYPKCKAMSEARKKAIKARINSGYALEDFEKLFTKAEASSFLKGKNTRNWSASFDWLISDANMAKVLDGNYDDKGKSNPNRMDDLDGLF